MASTFDDEMIRLAAEMSIIEDSELDFNPHKLDETRERINELEKLVDEHLLADQIDSNPTQLDNKPISSAQIREIFAVTEVRVPPRDSTPGNLSTSYNERDSESVFSALSDGFPQLSVQQPSRIAPKESCSKETIATITYKLKWYQKKLVHQIEQTHENHTYTDGRLAVLLELSDYISNVLQKIDQITPLDVFCEPLGTSTPIYAPLKDSEQQTARTRTRGGRRADPSLGGGLGNAKRYDSGEMSNTATPLAAAQQQAAAAAANSNPTVVSAVYALRRGGTRQETLTAVEHLALLCNAGGELCLPAVKQMCSAGALQSLLSTLQRAAEWPEVERQISKVLSILVTYEDDWILLQRSAMIILTALYTLQVKTLTQCRSTARAAAQAVEEGAAEGSDLAGLPLRERTASCASQASNAALFGANNGHIGNGAGLNFRPPSAPMSPDSLVSTASMHTIGKLEDSAGPVSRGTSGGIAMEPPTRERSLDSEVEKLFQQQQRDQQSKLREKAEYLRRVQEEAEEEQESLKCLISAAVTKLSLVLAYEWGKLATPLGGFGQTGAAGAHGLGMGMGMGGKGGSNSRLMDAQRRTNSALASSRNLAGPIGMGLGIGLDSGMSSSGPNRGAVENDRILQSLLNLIETLADDSLNPTRTQLNTFGAGAAGTLGVAAITKILVKSAREEGWGSIGGSTGATGATTAEEGESPAADQQAIAFGAAATAGGLTVEPAWKPPTILPPGAITRQNSVNSAYSDVMPTDASVISTQEQQEILRQGAIFFSPLMRVDSAAVMCSAALCNLAEIPQCRPGLVSSGALKMIKRWLEIGIDVLAQARVLCFNRLSTPRTTAATHASFDSADEPDCHHMNQAVRDNCHAFMEAFGPAYELISNAAATLMHLSGGSDCRFAALNAAIASVSPRNGHHHGRSGHGGGHGHGSGGSGGRDYIVGWIDAQILAEGLPAVVVRMLHTAVEAFTSLSAGEAHRPTRSVLPATVGMHLAQTLFQLCSRVQNRHQLQAIDIPFALCILFENISGQTKLIHEATSDDDTASLRSAMQDLNATGAPTAQATKRTDDCARVLSMDTIYSHIFHFDGIYSSRGWQSTLGGVDVDGHPVRPSTCSASTPPPSVLRRNCSEDFLVLYSANVDNKFLYRRTLFAKITPSLRSLGQPYGAASRPSLSANMAANVSHPCLRQPVMSQNAPIMRLAAEDIMPVLASITSSCLDALTYFFADEISRVPYTTAGVNNKSLTGGSAAALRASFTAEFTYKQYYATIVDLMCSERVIDSIKLTSSFLTRGAGRLAAIRIISALTEWPESLSALYDCGIMDVLMLISSESDEIEAQRIAAAKLENPERETGNSFFSSIFPGRPQPAERGTSGASTVSAISSVTSRARSFYNEPRGGWSGDYDHHDGDADDYEDEENGAEPLARISLEETITVCYALANMCEASDAYALRMFQSGLFAIMLKLVRSANMEISRQALRCISAMCGSIVHDPIERAKYAKTKGKDASRNVVFLEVLSILVDFLKSPSALLQRGAVITIGMLALLNEPLQDAIVNGPLRTITSMRVDPKSDREFRGVVDDLLRNLGFLGGDKDLELCGYDFGTLRDWYLMRRSQKPQEEALTLLRVWVDGLFDDSDRGLANTRHERQPAEHLTAAQELLLETAAILSVPIYHATAGGGKAHGAHHVSRDSFDAVGDAAAGFLGSPVGSSGLSGGAGVPSASAARITPLSLHRNFTESIMRMWPFSGIKSPFQDCQAQTPQRHSLGNHGVHHDDTYDNSPAGGGGQVMNRSVHPSASLPNLSAASGHGVLSSASHMSQSEQYDWMDRLPQGILQLMELFYSSRLHQHLLMDMTSLGVALTTQPSFDADPFSEAEEVECDYDIVYLLPHPHSVTAIMLPARSYQTFGRVARVVEKMVEYSADSNKMWSLIFRDSEYLGEFHTSLLASLRRCPQICSLSFSSSHRVEDEALMGHLVGQLPPSVRFVSFKSTLSKESIQALCILLRTHNAAFLNHDNNGDSSAQKGAKRRGNSGKGQSSERPRKLPAEPENPADDAPLRSKGLLGLALTHLTFEATEINYIIELLQHRGARLGRLTSFRGDTSGKDKDRDRDGAVGNGGGNSSGAAVAGAVPVGAKARDSGSTDTRGRSNSDSSPKSASDVATPSSHPRSTISPHTPLTPHQPPTAGGLRYLDLSYNSLNDLNCSRVLTAALNGPLEGLELGGNHIHRGTAFCEVMTFFAADKMTDHRHRLRCLGLSNNNLTTKTVVLILDCLISNVTLTALDLSNNDIDHTVTIHEALRRFLRGNCGLRALDLSHNRLNPETYKEIHLGLLENETLLLLPMAGNTQIEVSPTVGLIQMKLRENRVLYKSQADIDELHAQRGKLDVFQTEEELGMRISFGADLNDKELAMARAGEPVPYTGTGEDHETAVEMQLPVIAVEAAGAVDAVITSVEDEHGTANIPRAGSGLSLINPSLSRKNSRTAAAIEDSQMPSDRGIHSLSHPLGAGTAAAAAAGDSSGGIKVPGYSIAIAVPVNAYDHPTTMGSSGGLYNYNNGRANVFGNSAAVSTSPRPLDQPQGEDQPQSFSGYDRPSSTTGSIPAVDAMPGVSQYSRSRPNSQNTPASSTGLTSIFTEGTASLPVSPLKPAITIDTAKMGGEDIHPHAAHTPSARSQAASALSPHHGSHFHTHPLLEAGEKFSGHTLNVLFSAPLAGFDRNAKPHPLEVLDYSSERELLMQVFREVRRDVNVHFDFATTDSLRTALSFGCKALHFSGHGIPKGLCFEDGRLGLQVVKVNQLKDLLGAGGLQLQFVFVSACYSSEIGDAFVKAGVPHVVCVKVDTKIQDAAAIAFTRAFYVALLSGKTVKNSFLIAREALKLSPYVSDRVLEGDKFVLLPDYAGIAGESLTEGAAPITAHHHNQAIFPSRPVCDWPVPNRHCTMGPNLIDVRTFLASNRLPAPPADFEGREVVMHNLIRHILERRLVSLVGEDGVGKSAVAAAVCKYLADREMFPDSIVYFRAKGIKDYRSFLSGLLHALQNSGSATISGRIQALLSNQRSGYGSANLVYPEEEVIFSCLESLRMLLVMDTLDELIADYGESHTEFRLFLGRLFEQCPHVKVLVVATDTLAMHNINLGYTTVEYSVLLGPLTLISTLRLFARLAPSLSSPSARREFIASLQPARQLHVSVNSRDVNKTALQILSLFGDGHPAKIVHMACESTPETVEHLRAMGNHIIQSSALYNSSAASVGGYSVASYNSTPTIGGMPGFTPNLSTSTSFNNHHSVAETASHNHSSANHSHS